MGALGMGGQDAGPRDGRPVCELCSSVTNVYSVPAGLESELMAW